MRSRPTVVHCFAKTEFRNSLELTTYTETCKDRPVTTQRKKKATWDARRVKALRRHLGYTQRRLADELGTRQQTISEWETGQYRPRGPSARLLTLVAEEAEFPYEVEGLPAGQASAEEGEPGAAR